ncbi:helix-turn-helix domain-containing protein [Segnochrobactrum spirostomi]|nr:AraC family transcriptional regulator [Segnochrobactrum spirostomi]
MMKTFRWGRSSELIEAGIVTPDHLRAVNLPDVEFASKTLTEAEGEGRLEYLRTPDVRAIVANCAFHHDKRYEMTDEGLVRFHFGYDVSILARVEGRFLQDVLDHPAGLLIADPDTVVAETVPAGRRQTFVTIACHPEWIERTFGVKLTDHLDYEADLSIAPACHYPLRYDGDARRLTAEMLETRIVSSLKPAFLAAKAQEILAFALSSMIKSGTDRAYKHTDRDLAAVRAAHDLLLDAPMAAHDLRAVSRAVGINRTKLSYGFQRLYGLSMSQFVTIHRLEEARRLLLETDMTISQIALAVGYEHACNFSTRFKAQFECSPRAFRASNRQ